MPPKKNATKVYMKLDQIDHILLRSDMYVGSTRPKNNQEYIAEEEGETYLIYKKDISFSPALLRIFIEPLSNAIDNVERSKNTDNPSTKIKININSETGQTTIWNDGDVVPVEINEQENCYNHSMIFGQLLTGSNYNDEEERVVSGRNGIGIKACNIFSSYFKVTGLDPHNGKIFTQEWSNNMKNVSEPVIKKTKLTKGYTEITWIPDFSRFHISGYSEDIVKLYTKYIIDSSMLSKVKVYLNDKLIPVNNLSSYAQLYRSPTNETITLRSSNSEVVLTPSTEFQAISFVNGIYTKLGGQHVDAWSEAIFRPLVNKFNKKGKPQLTIKDIKQFFIIFVNAIVINPEFDSQEKNKLESPAISVSVKVSEINTICRWSVIENIEDMIRSKELVVLKKSERKKSGFVKIEGLDPANNAGGRYSTECTLILCEGLSAKTYAVAGIEKGVYGKSGRDWHGILPLRGKCLNVRNSAPTIIAKNAVITDLIKAMGVRHDVDYTDDANFRQLNYGKIMLLTDADSDGLHIEALLLNFFHSLFPSLLLREKSFVISMKTPIVRVFKPNGDLLFYDERKFKHYAATQNKNFKKKYYKGLGTTRPEDVPDTFGLKIVEYTTDENTNSNMNKVFDKRYADQRKEWLENYNPESSFSLDDQTEISEMNISTFIDNEFIKFSHDDCKRSIPNIIDGLKESQRKIIFAAKKRNLKYNGTSLKVAQFGGYVAEHSNYHHGEQNLFDTIIKLANEFPGSNNIPLFYRDGMFGCVDPSTPILLWDSSIKRADEIVINDILIGDDGQPRTVSDITSGVDEMYKITQGFGEPYIVNSHHILTLKYSGNKSIFWKESTKSWVMTYFDPNVMKSKQKTIRTSMFQDGNHHKKSKLSKEEAYKKMIEYSLLIPDNDIFDINVQQYLSLSNTDKHHMKGVKNSTTVQWDKQDVPIDPYIFGAWLGDGDQDGHGFTTMDQELVKSWVIWCDSIGAEVIHNANGKNHENYHYCIRRRKGNKTDNHFAIGDKKHSSKSCIGCLTSNKNHPACDWIYENKSDIDTPCFGLTSNGIQRNDFNPFVKILKEHKLYKNKHIPTSFILNSENIRLQLLAGFIDTDGSIKRVGNVYNAIISQEIKTNGHLIDSLQLIARSLGFRAEISIRETHKTKMKSLIISGNDFSRIPTRLPHKNTQELEYRRKSSMCCNITVERIGRGRFCGWNIDSNERFLLGDFTITHNTRINGGKDAASPRYIFTKMDMLTHLIYREEDDILLHYRIDDGDSVEPTFYIPIIPMILVNGCIGIGTGWSSSIPSYNPLDLIDAIKVWIENDGQALITDPDDNSVVSLFPTIQPWYRGFTGQIEPNGNNRYITKGIIETSGNKCTVSELPIGLWTDKFKEHLEDFLEKKEFKNIKNYSTPKKPNFVITQDKDRLACSIENLKLYSYLYTSNMVLFTKEEKIKKYDNIEQIIDYFCSIRYDFYIKRKRYTLNILEAQLKILKNKSKFIQEVIDEELIIFKVQEEEIINNLEQRGYDKDEENGYNYLLRLQVKTFTIGKIRELQNEVTSLEQKINILKATSEKQLWLNELQEFEDQYRIFLNTIEGEKSIKKKKK